MHSGDTPSVNRAHSARPAPQAGFTLVEILIAVLIVGVLLAVAYPSYLDAVRKGRRAEAVNAVTQLMQAQERFRANNPTYGNLDSPANSTTLPADLPRTTKHYNLSVSDATAQGYAVIATAKDAQAQDSSCKVMGVQAVTGTLRYGSGSSSINWAASEPDAGRCWAN